MARGFGCASFFLLLLQLNRIFTYLKVKEINKKEEEILYLQLMTLQNICSMVDFMFTIIDLCKIFVPELEFPIMIPVFANFMRWKFGKMVAKIFPWLIWV